MLIECKECNKKISDTAKTCPNCGYGVPKKENSFLQLIGVVILIIISIPIFNTLIYGNALDSYGNNIKVTNMWSLDGDFEVIKGTVKNEGDKAVNNVKLTAYYYDGYGKTIGSETVYLKSAINPGSYADFEITHRYSSDEKKYELKLEDLIFE